MGGMTTRFFRVIVWMAIGEKRCGYWFSAILFSLPSGDFWLGTKTFPFLQGIKTFPIPVPESLRNILSRLVETRDVFLFDLFKRE